MEKKERMIIYAAQQFDGYYYGKQQDIIGMVEAMDLTADEWEILKSEFVLPISDCEKEKIDNYFKSKSYEQKNV